MTFTNMVVMIVVSVGLSLGCAYILFKKLKSFAETETEIKGKKIQLGGAIAGFVVILGILLYSFDGWQKNETVIKNRIDAAVKEWKPQEWTILAKKVKRVYSDNDNGNGDQSGIVGRLIFPPKPMEGETNPSGYFRLDKVVYVPGEGWPDIVFEHEGFYPVVIDNIKELIAEKKAKKIEEDKKLILLEDEKFTLHKIEGGEK